MARKTKREPMPEQVKANYTRAGFRITEHDHADAGQVDGTCVKCGRSCIRYGPVGHPFCGSCR